MAVDSRAKTYRQNWGVGQIAVQDRCGNPVGKLEVKPLDEKPTYQALAEQFINDAASDRSNGLTTSQAGCRTPVNVGFGVTPSV